jgi:hypothetical protein
MYNMTNYVTGRNKARFTLRAMFLGSILVLAATSSQAQPEVPEIYQYGSESYDPMLQRVRVLVRANVLGLAQSILESEGPPSLPNQQWLDWERQLWTLYRVREDWDGLYERTRQLPPAFPAAIKSEADSEAIYASIADNRGKRARSLLRKNLVSGDIAELDKRKLRKTLIESYLADNLLFEAGIAMEDYQSDYRSSAEDWLVLSAKVNLRLNDADGAVNLLAPLEFESARLLRIFARLQNNSITHDEAISRANGLLAQLNDPDSSSGLPRHHVLSVILQAELDAGNQPEIIDAMEQYLIAADQETSTADSVYPHYEVEDLLSAYSAFAEGAAGEAGIRTDSETKLFNHAVQLPDWNIIVRKSLFAHLLQQTKDDDLRSQLNDLYVLALIQSERTALVSLIFGEGKPFENFELGGNAGVQLSNIALQNGDIKLAAQVSSGLTETPESVDPLDWMIHVARISIIAGDYDQGVKNLSQWIASHERLSPAQADRVLQPIFDLQTVHQHVLALDLLHQVYERIYYSTKHRREIAYWIAESYQGTEDYMKAADYFLFSAMQKENGFDQWGKAARFRAAESLQSAALLEDSRKLIEDLLANAEDEGRKIQLQHKIQELWLLESGSDSGESQE